MNLVHDTTKSGEKHHLEIRDGLTLMETIREGGVDELLALCGGCCSCATCHVYIDQEFADRLPPMLDDENDLLDSSSHCVQTSRLSCQIGLSAAPDGLPVRIAPED